MKAFVFRYQKILEQREKEEDAVKTRLGEVQHQLQALNTKKTSVLSQQQDFQKQMQEKLTAGIRSAELRIMGNAREHYQALLESLEQDITQTQLRIISIKKELAEAVKNKKVMEKLKEKEYEEYMEAVQAAENKMIEEIVNYRNSQKSGDV